VQHRTGCQLRLPPYRHAIRLEERTVWDVSGSNDLLMGEVLRTHEQQVWFLAEHLVDTPLLRA
jgi:hypothetical protein